MTRMYVLNEVGEPVPATDGRSWGQWFQNTLGRTVAADDVESGGVTYRVSTVFLGLDHRYYGDGEPILWETLVFVDDGSIDSTMRRYTSRAEAEAGHAETIEALQRGEVPE